MAKKNETEVTYKSTITTMSPHITRFQAVMMTGSGDKVSIGDIVEKGNPLYVRPIGWLTQHIVNSKSDDGEYEQLLILADDGTVFSTGSSSFIKSFESLMDSIDDMGESEIPADWKIKVTARDSKNYKGKHFLTCSIVTDGDVSNVGSTSETNGGSTSETNSDSTSETNGDSTSETNGDCFASAPSYIATVMQ